MERSSYCNAFTMVSIVVLLSLSACTQATPAVVGPPASPSAAPAASVPPAAPTTPGGDGASHVRAAEQAASSNNLSLAEQEYKNALALDPRSAAAQLGLGNVYVRQNRMSDAETAYKAALAIDPKLVSAHANLGVVYYQLGQFPKAREEYDAALKNRPDDAETLYLLAATYLQEQNLVAAEPLLIKARDLKPSLPEVYYGLGILYKLKGQKTEAIAAFEKFLQIGPGQDPSATEYAQKELKGLKGQ